MNKRSRMGQAERPPHIDKAAARRLLEHLINQVFWNLEEVEGAVARAGLRVALVSLDAWGPEEVRVQDLLHVFRELQLSASSVVQWLESDGTYQPIGWRQLWAPVLSALRQAMQGT